MRNALIFKLIVLIVVFLLLAVFAVRLIVSGGSGFVFNWNLGNEGTLESTDSFSGITAVQAEAYSYAVYVQEHSGTNTTVEFYSTGFGNAEKPEISCKGGVLTVKEQARFGIHFGSGRIVISVPADSKLDYKLTSVSGSMKLNATGNNVDITNTSGSVKVWGGGTKLSVASVSGSVKIYDAFESIDVKSTSGSVKVVADTNTKSVSLSSTSGSIKLMLPTSIGYKWDYTTVSGSVKDEYRGTSYSKNGAAVYGDESLLIKMKNTSGSSKLCDWSDD